MPTSSSSSELTTHFLKVDNENNNSTTTKRLIGIDLFRGLIMIVMAWDHSKDFLANKKLPKHQGGSAWSGELQDFDHSFLLFFARFISHFCAPGFFYTMGIGMVLFTKSRLLKKKWSKFKIVKHFLIRGFVLLLVGRLVDIAIIFQVIPIIIDHKPFPIEKIFGGSIWTIPFIGIWEVMTGLSYVMIVVGLFIPTIVENMFVKKLNQNKINIYFQHTMILLIAILSFILSNYTIVHAQNGDPCGPSCHEMKNSSNVQPPWPREEGIATGFWEIFLRYTLIPGRFSKGVIIYPLIPWISMTLFGIVHGYGFSTNPTKSYLIARYVGIISLIFFICIRLYGHDGYFGNLRGLPRDGVQGNWLIAFLNVCKYPPSIAYTLLTLGIDLLILGTIERFINFFTNCCSNDTNNIINNNNEKQITTSLILNRILLAYGKVPLFFYLIHFQVLGVLSMILQFLGNGLDLDLVIIPYIFVLMFMFFICEKYSKYKMTLSSESWIRNYL